MTDLIALAERCEAAEGPDRELDAAIAQALGKKHGADSGWCNSENGDYWMVDECAATVTASLDAAMTLAGDDPDFDISREHDGTWLCTVGRMGEWTTHGSATAKTPALALCAAVLRALANTPPRGSTNG